MGETYLSTVGGGVSRRGFLKGALGAGVVVGLAASGLETFFDLGEAYADQPTISTPSATSPEQVHLQVGDNPASTNAAGYRADPTSSVTLSWLAAGSTAQAAPSAAYGTVPISTANPGTVVTPTHLAVTDDMSGVVSHVYHAALTGLAPATTYYYAVSSGNVGDTAVNGSFTTAPADTARTPWRFSSFGDLGTPYTANPSGTQWSESSNNARAAVAAIAALSPQPVVHLLNGDICYANLDYSNHVGVWRDFFVNLQASAQSVPWMPCLGNHEIEWGTHAGTSPHNSSGNVFNDVNGYRTYLSRFALPDNGISGYHGNFYSFQVGTVLFISLDADDVIYQDGGSYYAPTNTSVTPSSGSGTSADPWKFPPLSPNPNPNGVAIAPGASAYNNQYTGGLAVQDDAHGQPASLVPTTTGGNAQTQWLATTLSLARAGGTTSNELYPGKLPIDMIVVQMHQCALSSSASGNGSDLGIRQAWLPLFEQYGVDLVVSGHEHNYERTHAVKGYNPASVGVAGGPGAQLGPGQTQGQAVFTRQPAVTSTGSPSTGGNPGYDTSAGTVFLVLGGGGVNGPTGVYLTDGSGKPAARVITQRNVVTTQSNGNWFKYGADTVEPAPWSARVDGPSYNGTGTRPAVQNSWGFAVFDVDPGAAPGQTVITMRYYDAPAANTNEVGGKPYSGTTAYSSAPLETVVFSHGALPAGPPPALPEFPTAVAAGVAAAAVVGGAAVVASHRRDSVASVTDVAGR